MDHKISPRESWIECRRSLEQRLGHSQLFAAPLRAIDWALAGGGADWLYAWLSHDNLVVSNRQWDATLADRVVVIPKSDSIELRLSRDGDFIRKSDTDQARLEEELDSYVSEFRRANG